MNLVIRAMMPADYDQKGYIHWKAWQETYTGLMDERILANHTIEKCQQIARRWPDNTLIVELDGVMIGFGCFAKHDNGEGEVAALYLLKDHQGCGIGRKLMDALLTQLADCNTIFLWVLQGNDRAIGFYQHYGFRFDNTQKHLSLGTELRMIFRRP